MDMNKIVDRIYLGSEFAAENTHALRTAGITHILTIHVEPLSDRSVDINYKFVECLDMPEADILMKFEECFQFIDEALSQKENAVLIHCLAGVSRSATIMAAYLMYRDKMCLDEALGTIKEHRPCIRPNPGFMRQLELFEKMGSNIDPSNEHWRRYKLSRVSDRVQWDGKIDDLPSEAFLSNPDDAQNKNDSYFKCRKCRQALFRSSGIMTHHVGKPVFDWRGKISSSGSVEQTEDRLCTQSLFIEPVKWMADFINQQEGKIHCPKCHAKLGSFVWFGESCPCGCWVAPAFHIQKSKVDEVLPRQMPISPAQTSGQGDIASHQDMQCSKEPSVCDTVSFSTDKDNSAISKTLNEKQNEVNDPILDEILHRRKNDDYS